MSSNFNLQNNYPKITLTLLLLVIFVFELGVINPGLNSASVNAQNPILQVQNNSNLTYIATQPTCSKRDSFVSDPAGPHGIYERFPPTSGSDFGAVENDIINNNPTICGATFYIAWSQVSPAPGLYNFSSIDSEILPWTKAGKSIGLVVTAISDMNVGGSNALFTPQYVLANVPYITNKTGCPIIQNDGIIPIYWNTTYVNYYHNYMQAVIKHYNNNTNISYIRFGLAAGGETYPFGNVGNATCQTLIRNYGYTDQVWTNYITNDLNYESTLGSKIQLGVGINVPNSSNKNHLNYTVPNTTAAVAVSDKIGFGSQGLSSNDITNYNSGKFCTVNWCNLFNKYKGKVPLELQTEVPGKNGYPPGGLNQVVPFAITRHTQILEIYNADLLAAYDPSNPNYTFYHISYASTLKNASKVLGISTPKKN